MTTLEAKLEAGLKLELSEVLEAIRVLDAQADEICRVDMIVSPAWAVAKLAHIDSRKRELKRQVRLAVA